MPKGQQRSNREPKKPKAPKKPAAPAKSAFTQPPADTATSKPRAK